jgi:hypothetical protein
MDIIQALRDSNLIGAVFPSLESWSSWITALKTAYAIPMDGQEIELFQRCTGRETPPATPAKEVYYIVGRRGGKGRMAGVKGAFLAAFQDYSGILAPGEEGLLPIIASDREQAKIVLNYTRDIFLQSPILKPMLLDPDLTWELPLKNRITIRVMTCSKAAVRGYTLVGAVLEESAFWRVEGANPDREIVRALRPGRLTTKGPLIVISTPYRQAGIVWEAFKKHWGKDGPILVWVADSLTMNPLLDAGEIEQELAEDPEAARAEYFCEFRSDLEDFLPLEAIEAVIIPGRFELPPVPNIRYLGFVDPSGGRADAAALAVGHAENGRIIVDSARRWPAPHDPGVVVGEMAGILKSYGLRRVIGDRYAGAWPEQEFKKYAIGYESAGKTKSEFYLDFLPLVLSQRVELPESKHLVNELRSLERRTRSGGKDSVDHAPRGSDDLSNAVAGVCALLGSDMYRPRPRVRWIEW